MFNESDYLGKSLEEAQLEATSKGFIHRVTMKDGVAFIVTMECNSKRVPLEITDDIVTRAYIS